MRVPLSWLKHYVSLDLPPHELAHKITMAGVEVKQIEEIGDSWEPEKVIVGHVLDVAPHPNADRLKLPTVDLGGSETATVVCGAPNVAAGQKIAFAREGVATLQRPLREEWNRSRRPRFAVWSLPAWSAPSWSLASARTTKASLCSTTRQSQASLCSIC